MEVTPEMYAWLTDINVINPFGSMKGDLIGNFILPEKTVNLLLGGKYFDKMLTALQSAYNKFYKLKLDYLSKLKDLKQIDEDQEYISNSVKYANWHLINEMLNQFGISYTESQIMQVINGDKDFLQKVMTQIYYLCNQFLKHCQNNDKEKDNSNNNENNKDNSDEILSLNKTKNNKNNIINNNKTQNLSQLNKSVLSTNTNNNNKKSTVVKPKKNETVNINNIDSSKAYEDCSTCLEFFILSLSKNFDMKPRQCVALLSNNRKYLSVICKNGLKGDYSKIKKWLKDISLHSEIMMRLIPQGDDGLNVSFGTIGTALCCPDSSISILSAQLLNKMNLGIKMNWTWLKDEGINSLIQALNRYEKDEEKIELLNIIYDFIKGGGQTTQNTFFMELRKKLATNNEKGDVLEMLSNVIPVSKDLNSYFLSDLQNFVYEICFAGNNSLENSQDKKEDMVNNSYNSNNENNNVKDDVSKKISLLSDAFYYFNPTDEKIIDKTINFFKKCVRFNGSKIVYSTAVVQNFLLMEKFGKKKNKYGPTLYKNLVFLFLENYDNEEKRQFILENFENFFKIQNQIPIDIFLEPYLDQLNSVDNFSLCDLEFIFRIIEHPRIQSKDLIMILKFLLIATNKKESLSRVANVIIQDIFQKKLIEKICTIPDREKIIQIFIDHIKSTFDLLIKNIRGGGSNNTSLNISKNSKVSKISKNLKKNQNFNYLLETPYDIMMEDFPNLNEQIHQKLISTIKNYRKLKKSNSAGLLAMLWYFPDHDEILLQVEEEFRPVYESVEIIEKKMIEEQKMIERRDFNKRMNKEFNEIKDKRVSEKKNLEEKNNIKKKKEEKIKKNLEERRKIDRILSGADQLKKPQILTEDDDNISNINLNILPTINETYITETDSKNAHSNMLSAIDAATKKFISKGALTPLETETDKKYLKKNNFVGKKNFTTEFQEKKKDDVIEKYGKIISIDKMKKKEDALKEYKRQIRIQSIKNFIVPEGSLVKILPNGKQEPADPKFSKKYAIFITKPKNYNFPLDLDEEEDRDKKAIDGYSFEFRKNTKFYFKCYTGNDYQQFISKKNILKMLRDRGIDKSRLDLDEMNQAMRSMFGENINDIDFNKFSDLLVQLSYLIFIKKRPSLTIGECYGNLIRRFTLAENTENTEITKKKMQPAIELLLEKKSNQEPYNLPDGFKFTLKSKVKYNNRLAPHFEEILGESKFICYQILEDIIFNIFKTSIIEPYVELETEDDIILEPEKLHRWTPKVTMTYIEMGEEYKEYGKIVCDALEEGFKNFYKGKNIKGENLVHYQDKKMMEEKKERMQKEQKSEGLRMQRKIEIEEKLSEYKKKKEEKRRQKLIDRKILRDKNKEALIMIREKFAKVEERRKKLDEEKKNKLKSEQEKKAEKEEQKNKALLDFYREQRRKLKEQFSAIKDRREGYFNYFREKGDGGEKELKVKIHAKPKPTYLHKDKEYVDFENKLNQTMKELMEREDIKAVFDKYEKHLQYIYDVYSKCGYNKISFYSKEVMNIDEFKQFLINFTVLGLLISTDQMIWIFNKIAKVYQEQRDAQVYLEYEDFKLSLCYLAVFARFTERSRKLLPSDLDNTNGGVVESFMKFLGLKRPFKKLQMENFMNDRRGMTMKQLIEIQRKMKTNANDYKNGEIDKEEKKKKEERKKLLESKRAQKKSQRDQEDEENEDNDEVEENENSGEENSGGENENSNSEGNKSGGD